MYTYHHTSLVVCLSENLSFWYWKWSIRGVYATTEIRLSNTIFPSSVVPSLTASSVLRLWRDQCVFLWTEQTFVYIWHYRSSSRFQPNILINILSLSSPANIYWWSVIINKSEEMSFYVLQKFQWQCCELSKESERVFTLVFAYF